MPTLLIDADGCPVVDLTVQIGRAHGVPVKILCDTAHRIEREGAETLVFDKGADSVDFALVRQQSRILASKTVGLLELTLSLEDAQVFQKAHNSVIKPSRWRDIDLEIYL